MRSANSRSRPASANRDLPANSSSSPVGGSLRSCAASRNTVPHQSHSAACVSSFSASSGATCPPLPRQQHPQPVFVGTPPPLLRPPVCQRPSLQPLDQVSATSIPSFHTHPKKRLHRAIAFRRSRKHFEPIDSNARLRSPRP